MGRGTQTLRGALAERTKLANIQMRNAKPPSTRVEVDKTWWRETNACLKQGIYLLRDIIPFEMDQQIDPILKGWTLFHRMTQQLGGKV